MYKHTTKNIHDLIKIAHALGNLNDQVVYVGGAVASLYADAPGAPDVRPTQDLDIVIEITSHDELELFRDKLAKCNIYPAQDSGVICRFNYDNILLDVLSTKTVGWAPANPWFKTGYENRISHNLNDITIQIFPFSYYMATKFSAFHTRGCDPRTSHDFEDIVYLMDNRLNLVNDILNTDSQVKDFLVNEFNKFLTQKVLQEALLAHLEPGSQKKRYEMLMTKISRIVFKNIV